MLDFTIDESDGQNIKVSFAGKIDANGVDVSTLQDRVKGDCIFNLKKVEYVNSIGMKEWIGFMETFSKGRAITFEECSPSIINQINIIPEFSNYAKVKSFFAVFVCEECQLHSDHLFDTSLGYKAIMEESEKMMCKSCNHPMELDEYPKSYYSFLEHNQV